ncbi:MAG TPA: FTR1 family protein [Methylomirabilota bacterium]
MGGTFVITLREGFEAALVLGLIYTYLEKIGARREFRYVTVGALLGVVASLALGVMVTVLSGPLVDLGPDLIGAAILFAASATLTWHGWWMRQHARAIRGDVEQRIDAAKARQQFWVVGMIAFTGVFREGAETVLFIWGLLTQVGTKAGSSLLALGGVLGVLGAIVLGVLVFQGARQVSLRRFFAWTSGFLLLLAAGLFSTGVGRLQGLGLLPAADTLWDTSGWLDDGGFVGSLLAGLLGYRARPSTWEVGAYVAYLAVAGWLLFGGSARSTVPTLDRTGSPAGTSTGRR